MCRSSWRSSLPDLPHLAGVGVRRSADDVDPHGSCRAFDLAHRCVHVVGVEIGHLDARDLADLVAGDAADGLALGRRGPELDACGLAQQVRGGRRLEDERERAVLEDRDLRRDDLAGLVRGALVVCLGELDDVDAVGAERRADGRRRGRLAGRQLQRQDDSDLLGHWWMVPFLAREPGERRTGGAHSFSTWRKSSSTGVSRPKMLTSTLSLLRSGLTSSTVPMNSANGPSVTRTLWPLVNATRYFGVSTPMCRRICLTSVSSSGIGSLRMPGMLPLPTKLVTPGVLRTTNHDSGSRIISTST